MLKETFLVFALVGECVQAKLVYKDCTVLIHTHSTKADLMGLEMIEFDLIMGMDCLSSCYANVDFRAKIVIFQFPNKEVLEWKGCTALHVGMFISYLKAKKIMENCV